MDIIVDVVQGQRARVGTINLVNQSPFTDAEIRDRLRLKPKTSVTSEALERSVQNSRKWLIGRGYLGASRLRGARRLRAGYKHRGAAGICVCAAQGARESARSEGFGEHLTVLAANLSRRARSTKICFRKAAAICAITWSAGDIFDAEVDYTTSEDPEERPAGKYGSDHLSRGIRVAPSAGGFGVLRKSLLPRRFAARPHPHSTRGIWLPGALQFRAANQRRGLAHRTVSIQRLPGSAGEQRFDGQLSRPPGRPLYHFPRSRKVRRRALPTS